jgi:dipeptidyl aminopeptidase/acylaminoacyl peptidase
VIDEDRIIVRGFSMGGASTWHLAVHFPTLWAAANPGAGFSETPEFLRTFQNEDLKPTWYERKLWQMYDCTDWAVNLYHCPTVAYSGEIDRQKQAADIMAAALDEEGLRLTHIIGPKTAHAYEPGARDDVERRVSSLAKIGRDGDFPGVSFVTYTLKYNRCGPVRVDGLGEHWAPAEVLMSDDGDVLTLATDNVTALTLDYPAGTSFFDSSEPVLVDIDGEELETIRPGTDRSVTIQLHKRGDRWRVGPAPDDGLRKKHDLQGPIDDAFMDSFIFVRPTGKCRNAAIDAWSKAELDRAIEHWRRHFRGRARVKNDVDVTDADIAGANLVLWGDDQANSVWKKIADQLPIRYMGDDLIVGDGKVARKFDAANHAPILIYPNPLNPSRYVVTNSSFTFREYAYLNNARQVPMLPDWAVVDLREKPNAVRPGKIADADFFDERWRVRSPAAGTH